MEWNHLPGGWDENEHGNTLIEIQGNRVLGKRGVCFSSNLFCPPDYPPYKLEGNYLTVMANQAIKTLNSQYFELCFKNKMEDKETIVRYIAFGLGKDLPECGDPGANPEGFLGWNSENTRNCVSFHLDNFRIRYGDDHVFYINGDEGLQDSDTWYTRLENDIFGCGVDDLGKIYFTWNGKLIEYKQEFAAIDEKFENMHPFISLGIEDIEIIANFGEQTFLYNPNRSLSYTWRKCLSAPDFPGISEEPNMESMNFFDQSKDVSLVSTHAPDGPIKCHGLVLSCRSTYFKEMFENDGFKNRRIELPQMRRQIL